MAAVLKPPTWRALVRNRAAILGKASLSGCRRSDHQLGAFDLSVIDHVKTVPTAGAAEFPLADKGITAIGSSILE